ncbi:trihelix transcription factor GT-4-like isoform X3 [Harpegnathos saltator]|uniref:trihelix transcription factor GT-4-like isoform X3 n=1 Tax=Harpegnathos saltator TaxID=610380 RepID=UPI000DBED6EC|nr:trihelix transcription factor GT-4-like isoform X3 [Harpegnathos saltator]
MNFATLLLAKAKEQYMLPQATSERTHIWTTPETLLLLNIYGEYKDEYQNGKGTVKQYWDKVAKAMQDKGYDVTGMKCSTKFQALKRTYKSIMDHNNKSGNNRKEWEYLKIMNELFADKPWIKPLAVAGSNVDEDEKENTPQEKCKILKRES